MQTNLRIAMCTVSIALFSFALEQKSSTLCVVVFAVLIPFSMMIHSKQISIMRASAYIIVRFENRYNCLIWEKTVSDLSNDFRSRNTIVHLMIGNISYCFSSLLGLIILIFYFAYFDEKNSLNSIIISALFVATLLLDILTNSLKLRKAYIKEFEKKLKNI